MPRQNAIDTLDSQMLFKLNQAGRVKLVNGDGQEILPGIVAYTGGKHTFASQYVGVQTTKGTVVVASDNCYLYENLEKHAAIAQTLDAASNLAAQERMRKLAASARLIVPGHDPRCSRSSSGFEREWCGGVSACDPHSTGRAIRQRRRGEGSGSVPSPSSSDSSRT
jgi:glyoxylase-like metal-dependent hydrolase (beta-lactamase superfamily II)